MPTCEELIAAIEVFEKTYDGRNTTTAMHAALTEVDQMRSKSTKKGEPLIVRWYVGKRNPVPDTPIPGLEPLPFTIDT